MSTSTRHGTALPSPMSSPISSSVRVLPLSPQAVGRWDTFVEACPQATFFHRAGWERVIREAYGHRTHFLYAEANGVIEGVLPLAEIKSRLFGHALISTPFCVYGGVAAITERARAALNTAAKELAHTLQVGHLEMRNLEAVDERSAPSELYFTFRKRIDADAEKNLLAIPRKQRAMVRKGIKFGLQSEIDDNVGRYFDVYASNVHRHGTPAMPKRYFELLKQTFGGDCESLIVTHEGRPISAVLTFYFRDECLPYYAGDLPAARELAANDFKYWELMRRASERGYRVFDFGRSKHDTGPFDFKKNWGFEPQPLYYSYELVRAERVPENNPLNPKYRLMIATWRRLPLALATRLGPYIVKYLG